MNNERRKFLQCAIALSLIHYGRLSNAQVKDEGVLKEIDSNRRFAEKLRVEINERGTDIGDEEAKMFLFREANLRSQLKQSFDGVPSESIRLYVLQDQSEFADDLVKEGIPLIPPKSELRPVTLPETPDKVDCREDSLFSVLADIFNEWMGLQEFEGALKALIRESSTFRKLFNIDRSAFGHTWRWRRTRTRRSCIGDCLVSVSRKLHRIARRVREQSRHVPRYNTVFPLPTNYLTGNFVSGTVFCFCDEIKRPVFL